MAYSSKDLMAAAAVSTALLLGAVASKQLSAGPEAAQGHVRVGTAPQGSYALWATSLASVAVQQAVLGTNAGQPVYVRSKVCALPSPDGGDPGQYAVPGLVVVYDDEAVLPCDPAVDAQVEAWLQPRPDAPWTCACASDVTCLGPDAGPALLGVSFSPGSWSGAGCVPKPCAELGGVSSWPSLCPAK